MAIRLVITGRVQGVRFRQSLLEQAVRLGLAGWVRNRPDGSVEALAEGPQAALAQITTWARRGPPAARVNSVAEEVLPDSGLREFERRPTG